MPPVLIGWRCCGSIPACAGEPPRRFSSHVSRWSGLSPPVRGNRIVHSLSGGSDGDPHGLGSIPACAGEPMFRTQVARMSARVYPRLCGGTFPQRRHQEPPWTRGLSPPVRGNHFVISQWRRRWRGLSPPVRGNPPARYRAPRLVSGSIPACAGEPHFESGSNPAIHLGLSPPVRGNPTGMAAYFKRNGSIPACAGEPFRFQRMPAGRSRVYPRLCGGTDDWPTNVGKNRVGSIPACAGEPRIGPLASASLAGLSPPVRGNPDDSRFWIGRSWRRSIPACAGEP